MPDSKAKEVISFQKQGTAKKKDLPWFWKRDVAAPPSLTVTAGESRISVFKAEVFNNIITPSPFSVKRRVSLFTMVIFSVFHFLQYAEPDGKGYGKGADISHRLRTLETEKSEKGVQQKYGRHKEKKLS